MYNKYCIMYNILCIYDVCRYQTDRDFDENVTSIYVVNIDEILLNLLRLKSIIS